VLGTQCQAVTKDTFPASGHPCGKMTG
jgi:hypothetical protein